MAGAGGMVSMGTPMVPPYGAAMANQMGNMGMGPQVGWFNMEYYKKEIEHITKQTNNVSP